MIWKRQIEECVGLEKREDAIHRTKWCNPVYKPSRNMR